MAAPVRLAELMACLAAACELAMGQDAEQAAQGTAVALRLGQAWGLSGSELRDVYYQSLLRFIGCNADTQQMAAIAGDVIELRRTMAPLDSTRHLAVVRALLGRVLAENADAGRLVTAQALLRALAGAGRFGSEFFPGHCEVAQRLGQRLGLAPRLVAGLGQLYARWDGRGVPAVAREAVLPAVRVVTLAQDLVLHHRGGGSDAWPACERLMSERAGAQYDPALVAVARRCGAALLADLPSGDLAALEPPPHEWLQGQSLERALGVLADYADLQSPWLLGHSSRVAGLAEAAARHLGWSARETTTLRQAALLHDIGRVGISAGVWGKPGPLTAGERDRVRLHSQHTADVLARAPALAEVARLAAGAHERLDGSGYGRGLGAAAQTPAARLLAAADVVAALGEPRPHRPPLSQDEALRCVADEVAAGLLDGSAANAVLAAAGFDAMVRPPTLPAGLSEREAQVLGELARGRSNKEIARRLGIAPKTVGRHLESVYAKAGVRTRAGATLFALEQGLVARA